MKKYKLINFVSKEETICDKVTIDGFDYYVSDEKINSSNYEDFNFWFYNPYIKELQISCNPNSCHKVIATNNPNIDIPEIVDEEDIEEFIALSVLKQQNWDTSTNLPFNQGFIKGYNKSQETHSNSDDDMIEFAEWIADSKLHGYSKQLYEAMIRHKVSTTKELLQIWKEQKPKTVWYE